jgi:hypothetical protein
MATRLEIVGRRNVDAAAWLAVLLDAQRKGDSVAADHARRELLRIGVKVSVRHTPKGAARE